MSEIQTQVNERLLRLANADADEIVSGPLEQIRRSLDPLRTYLEMNAPRPDPGEFELGPMAFSDLSDDVHEAGIAWGAAKAFLHLSRRR